MIRYVIEINTAQTHVPHQERLTDFQEQAELDISADI
jgi:hypothetical protein